MRQRGVLLQVDSMLHPAVLVVEDDASIRTTLCAALATAGFRLHQAGNVDAALKILGTEDLDAIVLDVHIPDPAGFHRTGLSLLKFIRASAFHAEIPVMIFTAAPLSPAEELVVRVNRAYMFYKPHGFPELLDQLSELLDARAS
jgi:DNA-binding response OmpR family regulator